MNDFSLLDSRNFITTKKLGKPEMHKMIARKPIKQTDSRLNLKILEEDEVKRLLAIAKSGAYIREPIDDSEDYLMHRNYMIILLAVASGMRQGEILGLTWQCVDGAKIEIKHSLQYLQHTPVLTIPKNGLTRTIAIPDAVAKELNAWQECQADHAARYMGIYDNPLNLVFTNAQGGAVNGHRFTSVFRDMIATAGLEKVRFHDLRHYWARAALARGVSMMAVNEQLGHRIIDIPLSMYPLCCVANH